MQLGSTAQLDPIGLSNAILPSQVTCQNWGRMPKHLEVWADSFHEGEWFLQLLATQHTGTIRRSYRFNFQPWYAFEQNGQVQFVATVYGAYRCWDPVPPVIEELLSFGKPDVILYDRASDKIFFAVEETAAVPTGNQSLQRLERVHFAAERCIPFVYLVSEFGLHKDGGVRRTSIWPSYLALKLSSQYMVPSVTLLYGDRLHPEDYTWGSGLDDLKTLSYLYVREWLGDDVTAAKAAYFAAAYATMGTFIASQVDDISPRLPGRHLLSAPDFLTFIAKRITSHER